MKKTYYAPTIQTENVTIGVFGSYGTTGGNGGSNNGNHYGNNRRRRGGKKWYNFW